MVQSGKKIIGKVKDNFHSNNFCIKKKLFEKLVFPEELTGYGHEDTWMGIQLDLFKAKSCFIDNPVLHEGIETTESFLRKTDNALKNLLHISKITDHQVLSKHVRLFHVFNKLKKNSADWLIFLLYKYTREIVIKNLHSCHPSLLLFDWYRLAKLIQLSKERET